MPFSVEEFFAVFAKYNEAIWPLQIVAYIAGFLAVFLLFRNSRLSTIAITFVLALMWAINGIGYHLEFFAKVNPVARVFAALFVLQAMLFAVSPWLFPDLVFQVRRDLRSGIGLAMIVFAGAVYPVWGALVGHSYPAMPVFGVAPCPTTIFTIGVLLIGNWHVVRWLLIIPCIWAAIGGTAAILLQVPQDFGLLASLLIVLVLAFGHWRGYSVAQHEQ